MSDVSKTNELIVAKLRKVAKQAEWYQALDSKLLTAVADALEAATEGDYHEGLEEGIKIGRAERDAALAAIERVRAVLDEERAWHEHLVESGDAVPRTVIGIGKVEAALDGAPEPEEKP